MSSPQHPGQNSCADHNAHEDQAEQGLLAQAREGQFSSSTSEVNPDVGCLSEVETGEGEPGQPGNAGATDRSLSDVAQAKVLPRRSSASEQCIACVCGIVRPYLNKGSISNMCTFVVMVLGMMMGGAGYGDCSRQSTDQQQFAAWLLAAGLFGFAGGITNWLAVKMLFDRVCGLPGSGVIPMRFKEIREVVKNTIMKTFFDGPYLEQYMNKKMGMMAKDIDIAGKLKNVLESPEVDAMIDKQLTDLADRPEGMLLMIGGIQPVMLKPLVKPFVLGMAEDIAPMLGNMIDMKSIMSVEKLREEIDLLMTEKLQELTPERVKDLMEEVIRTHLGWLIVWGNVFGSLIGILSKLAGYP